MDESRQGRGTKVTPVFPAVDLTVEIAPGGESKEGRSKAASQMRRTGPRRMDSVGKAEWNILKSKMKDATKGLHNINFQADKSKSGRRSFMETNKIRAKVIRVNTGSIDPNLKYSDFAVCQTRNKTDKPPTWIIFHNNKWKQMWDFAILLLVIYIAVVVPWDLSKFTVESSDIRTINITIDFFFMFDIFVTFFTTFEDRHGEIVYLHKEVATHYLYNYWFLADVSTFIVVTCINTIIALAKSKYKLKSKPESSSPSLSSSFVAIFTVTITIISKMPYALNRTISCRRHRRRRYTYYRQTSSLPNKPPHARLN